MEFATFAKTLLKMAAALEKADPAGADSLTNAAETILRIAEEVRHSIHATYTRGPAGVLLTVEVREKQATQDEWSTSAAPGPLEAFTFEGRTMTEAKQKATPKIEELKRKYGVTQILENMDPSLPK
jgi:hypothetical protein